jgi:hypothetical protein
MLLGVCKKLQDFIIMLTIVISVVVGMLVDQVKNISYIFFRPYPLDVRPIYFYLFYVIITLPDPESLESHPERR